MSIENNLSEKKLSFDSDDSNFKIRSRVIIGEPVVPGIIKVLVKNKIVKNENQAISVLLVLFTLIVLISFYLINKLVIVEPAIIDPEIFKSTF